jgi:alpha-tubulin suppressor-like RCC1 family protein
LDVSGLSNILMLECTANGIFALDETGVVHAIAFSFAHLPDVSDWNDIIAISASATHIVGVTRDGRVLSRGASDMGQCDTQEWTLFTPSPAQETNVAAETTPAP